MTNCANCPNFLDEAKSKKTWGYDFGVPTCAYHGHILGMPGETEANRATTLELAASQCPDYGNEGPVNVNPPFRVFTGQETISSSIVPHLDHDRPKVDKCSECANYVPAFQVREAHGWASGACAMYGGLLSGNQAMTMPKMCVGHINAEWAAEGNVSVSVTIRNKPKGELTPEEALEGLRLKSWYSGQPQVSTVKVGTSRSSAKPIAQRKVSKDPTSGPFAREATDEERQFGILGWSKLSAPDIAKRDLEYPVFHPEFFTEAERLEIPSATDGSGIHEYVDFDNVVFRMLGNMYRGKTPVLVGHAGTGKTEGVRFLAYLMQIPFYRISISKATEVESIVGYDKLKNGQMEWMYGRLSKHLPTTCAIVVDEPNMGKNDVWETMRPLTDNAAAIVLEDKNGEVRAKARWCMFAMAMNPSWDPLYVGAQDISVADMSRINWVSVGHPDPKAEARIIKSRCALGDPDRGIEPFEIDKDELDLLLKISTEIRKACDRTDAGTLEYTWGIRNNLSVAMLLETFDIRAAFKMACTDGLDPEAGMVIQTIVEGFLP